MTIKIYKPSKTAMQSGRAKTKQWLAEYRSEVTLSKDTLMGFQLSGILPLKNSNINKPARHIVK